MFLLLNSLKKGGVLIHKNSLVSREVKIAFIIAQEEIM